MSVFISDIDTAKLYVQFLKENTNWLTGVVVYESFSLQSLSHSSNGDSQRWS